MEKSESAIQQEAIMHIWNKMPQTRLCLFHVPNGMFTNAREGAKFKAQGVIAGVPDLVFIWAGKTHYIEVKTEKGNLSKPQVELHKKWAEQGVKIYVARSAQCVIDFVESILAESV
jgi:hypothetical protein